MSGSKALAPIHPNGAGALATIGTTALTEADWQERKTLLHTAINRDANPAQVDVLIAIGRQYDLDPLLKHIDLIEGQVYVTHKGLLHKAHASGKLNGIELLDVGETTTHWTARVAVYRRDMEHPFIYPGRYSKAARNKNYGQEMAITRAECMALRRAFDIGLSVQEELDWGADSPPPAPRDARDAATANPGPADLVVMLTDDEVARIVAELHTQDRDGIAFPEIKTAAQAYANRATDEQWALIKAAVKAIADRRKAAAAGPPAGGEYQATARVDGQPVLGATEADRFTRLAQIRAAMARAGVTEIDVNRHCQTVYQVAAFELLTAAQADELIAQLESQAATPPVVEASTVAPAKQASERFPSEDAGDDDVPF